MLVIFLRLLIVAESAISGAQVGIRRRQKPGIGRQSDYALVLLDSFIHMAVFLKIGALVGAAHRITWIYFRRSLEVCVGFIRLVHQQQGPAQIVLRDEVFVGHGQRVGPQVVVAGPITQLPVGCNRQSEQHAYCRNHSRVQRQYRATQPNPQKPM